jgi:hypothetical protein
MRRALATALALGALALSGCGEDEPSSAMSCPSGAATVEERLDATELVGEPVLEAKMLAEKYNCQLRVVVRNGRGLDHFSDYEPSRINVEIEDGFITRVESVG